MTGRDHPRGAKALMRQLRVVLLGVIVTTIPASAVAAPIGYRGSVFAYASGGTPSAREEYTFGSVAVPVSSWYDLVTANSNGVVGHAHSTVEFNAFAGDIGAFINLEGDESSTYPDGNENWVTSYVSLSVSYHDHWRVDSPTLPPGVMVPFNVRLPSSWSSTLNNEKCGSEDDGNEVVFVETNIDGDELESFMRWDLVRSTTINGQTISGLCAEQNAQINLPVGVSVPMQLSYSLSGHIVSANPKGPGTGPIGGLGFTVNDLHTFTVFIAPAGPGYGLLTESGNSFEFPDTGTAPVPEPATLSLLGAGIAGLVASRRMKRR